MQEYIQKRVLDISAYILETRATVRQAAQVFDVSKSTVHMVLTKWNGFKYHKFKVETCDIMSKKGKFFLNRVLK